MGTGHVRDEITSLLVKTGVLPHDLAIIERLVNHGFQPMPPLKKVLKLHELPVLARCWHIHGYK
jgi:hypothetical protein